MIWAYLLHLGYNMWGDRPIGPEFPERPYWEARHYLRCDKNLWEDITARLAATGFNMLVIDLGEGVKYASHPEIAAKNAWSVGRLRRELKRLRGLGLEPIPKLNFSTTHDMWLGKYSRMVSTPEYYEVCKDLIAEVIDVFDQPRFFHIGMDEENLPNQRWFKHVVIRQYELWWDDLMFYVKEVEKGGTRAWMWSDAAWSDPHMYYVRMPKTVLQSNWYYEASFSTKVRAVQTYLELEKHGFDQVPTASNWSVPQNFDGTVRFCSKHVDSKRLHGFLQTVWRPTLEECRDKHEAAVDLAAVAIWKATR